MNKRSAAKLIAAAAVMLSGLAALIIGMALVVHGSDAPNAGGTNTTGMPGAMLALLGLFLFFTPPATLVVKAFGEQHRRYVAWMQTLTPQEQVAVRLAEAAATTAAAVAFHEYNRHQGEKIRARYDATDAAAARSVQMAAQQNVAAMQQNTGWSAGQPGTPVFPGQPGMVSDPTPRQYQPWGDQASA